MERNDDIGIRTLDLPIIIGLEASTLTTDPNYLI